MLKTHGQCFWYSTLLLKHTTQVCNTRANCLYLSGLSILIQHRNGADKIAKMITIINFLPKNAYNYPPALVGFCVYIANIIMGNAK